MKPVQRHFSKIQLSAALQFLVRYFLLSILFLAYAEEANSKENPIIDKIVIPWVKAHLEDALKPEPPLKLDQHTAFAEAIKPDNFKPIKLSSVADLNRILLKGDYFLGATFYCSWWGGHMPSQGVSYKLARAGGSMSKPISALYLKGNLSHVSPLILIAISWKIQRGLKYDEMAQSEQVLIDSLIPEYKKQIEGDAFGRFVREYNHTWGRVAPLNAILTKLLNKHPELKEIISIALLRLKERDILLNAAIAEDRLPDLLYEQSGDGTPRQMGTYTKKDSSRWVTIRPGVIGRYIIDSGFLKSNTLQLRVTDEAGDITLSDILNGSDDSQGHLLMAYPINVDAQISVLAPDLSDCKSDPPHVGDVIVFWYNGVIIHSGYITAVDPTNPCKVLTFNCYSIPYLHEQTNQDPDSKYWVTNYGNWTVYHTNRPDGRLIKTSFIRYEGYTDHNTYIEFSPNFQLTFNCHGYTFTNNWYFIKGYRLKEFGEPHINSQTHDQAIAVEYILKDNGYRQVHAEGPQSPDHFNDEFEVSNFRLY